MPVTLSQDLPGLTSTKTCKKCGGSFPLSQFYKYTRGGYASICKSCHKKAGYKNKTDNPIRTILERSRVSSKQKGLENNLTLEYLVSIDRDTCPYFEIPIKFYPRGKNLGYRPIDTKSLDRIDSSLGYVQGNVTFCSWGANNLLSNYDADQLLAVPLLHQVGLNFLRLLNSTKPTV